MSIENIFVFVISLILLWIKPGPGQAAIITRALADGFWPAFFLALGAMVGGAVYFVLAALGFVILSDSIIAVVLKLLGAGYLFYLGYEGLKDIDSGQWESQKAKPKKNVIKNFSTGLLIELSNPITIFYFIALLPTLVTVAEITNFEIFLGTLLIIYPGMIFYMIVIALAVQIKATLSDTVVVRRINLFSSIGFLLIGAFLLFSLILDFDASFTL